MSRIFVADVDRTRLAFSATTRRDRHSVADHVPQQIAELTNGVGVDLAIEAVGNTEPVNTAIDSVRKGGTVVLVGNVSPEIKLPLQKVVSRQLRLQGSAHPLANIPKRSNSCPAAPFR